jgi:hypothetical protein
MKKIIFTLLFALALGSLNAQVRVGVGFSFGSPYGIGYPYGGVVVAPHPVICAPAFPRYRYRRPIYMAPPMVYVAPRYRGMHYGRRW